MNLLSNADAILLPRNICLMYDYVLQGKGKMCLVLRAQLASGAYTLVAQGHALVPGYCQRY